MMEMRAGMQTSGVALAANFPWHSTALLASLKAIAWADHLKRILSKMFSKKDQESNAIKTARERDNRLISYFVILLTIYLLRNDHHFHINGDLGHTSNS